MEHLNKRKPNLLFFWFLLPFVLYSGYTVGKLEGTKVTISNLQELLLDGNASKEKMMTKGLYYLYGGPAWGKKIEYADGSGTVNLKSYLGKWCSSDDEYYVMCHFILSYIYLGGQNWNANDNLTNVINSTAIRKRFKKLIKENNLPEVVFHSLRHTSVTYKLKLNGGDIKAV